MGKLAREKRQKRHKKPRPNVMIFCEGETEEAYIHMIKRRYSAKNVLSNKIKAKSYRMQGLTLVQHAINTINKMSKKQRESFDEFYVMYDRDEQSTEELQQAIKASENNHPKIHTIYCNECFELWLLLHLDQVTTHLHREELYRRLEKKLSLDGSYRNYKGEQISTYVENFIPNAFKNAASLKIDDIPLKEAIELNPYTNFHQTLKHILAQNEIDF